MRLIKCTYFFGGIGLLFAFISVVLYVLNCNLYDAIGSVSTIISIVLGVVSIIYTYISGEHSNKTVSEINKEIKMLDECVKYICNQNEAMVSLINEQLAEQSFDYENLKSIEEKINDQILKAPNIDRS